MPPRCLMNYFSGSAADLYCSANCSTRPFATHLAIDLFRIRRSLDHKSKRVGFERCGLPGFRQCLFIYLTYGLNKIFRAIEHRRTAHHQSTGMISAEALMHECRRSVQSAEGLEWQAERVRGDLSGCGFNPLTHRRRAEVNRRGPLPFRNEPGVFARPRTPAFEKACR